MPNPNESLITPARRFPRLAGLLFDAAVDFALWFTLPVALLPADFAVAVFVVALPTAVLWEASCLRLFEATPGHWLSGTRVVWTQRQPPTIGWLCWRTLRRYVGAFVVVGQPSQAVPSTYAVSQVRPLRLDRIFAFIDKDHAVVVTRTRRLLTRTAVVVLACGLTAVGFLAAALNKDVQGPINIASTIAAIGALVNISSLWPAPEAGDPDMAAPPVRTTRKRRRRVRYVEPVSEAPDTLEIALPGDARALPD